MAVSLAPATLAVLYAGSLPVSYLPVEPDDEREVQHAVHELTSAAHAAGLEPTHVALTCRGYLVRHIALQPARQAA